MCCQMQQRNETSFFVLRHLRCHVQLAFHLPCINFYPFPTKTSLFQHTYPLLDNSSFFMPPNLSIVTMHKKIIFLLLKKNYAKDQEGINFKDFSTSWKAQLKIIFFHPQHKELIKAFSKTSNNKKLK